MIVPDKWSPTADRWVPLNEPVSLLQYVKSLEYRCRCDMYGWGYSTFPDLSKVSVWTERRLEMLDLNTRL